MLSSKEPAGTTEIAVAAHVSTSDQPQLDPDDPRYPRSRAEKALRWLAQRPLSGMLTYLGVALSKLGQVAQARGEMEEAERYYRQSLVIDREVQDRQGEGVDLSTLGQLAQRRGRLDEAEAYLQQSLVIHREVQDRQGEGVDLAQLGQLAQALEQWDDAEHYYRQCLTLMRDLQDALNEATISLILGAFLITKRGNRAEGCPLLLRAAAIRHERGLPGEEQARETARRLGCDVG